MLRLRTVRHLALGALGATAILAGEPAPVTTGPATGQPKPVVTRTPPYTGPGNPKPVVERPYLGITVDDSNFDGRPGVRVLTVLVGSTAEALGIKKDDRILSFKGTPIASKKDLTEAEATVAVKSEVTLRIKTGETERDVKGVMLGHPNLAQSIQDEQRKQSELLSKLGLEGVLLGMIKAERERIAAALISVANLLDALPDQVTTAAGEYKKLYPKGEFDLTISIRLASKATPEDLTKKKAQAEKATTGTDPVKPTTEATLPSSAKTGTEAPKTGTNPAKTTPAGQGPNLTTTTATVEDAAAAYHADGKINLSACLGRLAMSLQLLPPRLQNAANEFKKVYPEGVFEIDIGLHMLPDPEAQVVLDLSPVKAGEPAAPPPSNQVAPKALPPSEPPKAKDPVQPAPKPKAP